MPKRVLVTAIHEGSPEDNWRIEGPLPQVLKEFQNGAFHGVETLLYLSDVKMVSVLAQEWTYNFELL